MPWWSSSCGRVELRISLRDAQSATHPGPCDLDVQALSQRPYIARQFAKVDPARLRLELKDYGAWGDAELADHVQNLQRVLWIAAGAIVEGVQV